MSSPRKSRLGRTFRKRLNRQNRFDSGKSLPSVIKDIEWIIFRDWLKQTGFPKTKLTLAEFNGTGRGMMATKDIVIGEILISVPLRLIITPKSLSSTMLSNHISCITDSKLTAHQSLALYLILERHKNTKSSIYPYIQMLPKNFDTVPICLDLELLEFLPNNLKEDVKSQKLKFEKDFSSVCRFLKKQLNSDINITYNEFLWSWLCVNTRCIYFEPFKSINCDVSENIAIAPMLDFLNHNFDVKMKGEFNRVTQCYEITTFTPWKKGQQVFINYGPHDNFKLLLDYGFTIPNNPFNYILLDDEFFKLNNEVENFVSKKLNLLMKNGFYGDYALHASQISFRLLTALRLHFLRPINDISSQETQHLITKWQNTISGKYEIVSYENEIEVYEWIDSVCKELIKKCDLMLEKVNNTNSIPSGSLENLKLLWNESKNILTSVIILIQDSKNM
ncbi:SET domain-containing protein [Gigaspora margarita]|uniref:SET domain-containing protein n=1 Tax=Gigaspora margarita TaxID=4874 RepID=A0A8H3WXD7_GIGMA|nr:SET domain-containing protein [Gigaspora margarita]